MVEQALGRVANEPVRVHAAGRTDTGVHATGQVAHIDTLAQRSVRSWILGANSNLPPDVAVRWAMEVPEEFHARFRACSRSYRYIIYNHLGRPAVLRSRVTWECRPLDAGRMQAAAAHLVGQHDFSSFRAQECQARSPVRTVTRLAVERRGPMIILEIDADGFLHHMVRNIAGVLIAIGRGDRDPDWAREVLDARSRQAGGVTAAPEGLYLTAVRYPPQFGIPEPEPFEMPF